MTGRPLPARSGWRDPAFLAGSAAAHALLVLALVLPWAWPSPSPEPPPEPPPDRTGAVEVVMVEQPALPEGAAVAAATPPPPPPEPEAVAPPAPAAPPTVNLGTAPSDPWSVRSDSIRPPAPDARFRNLPPRYPAEAAQRGEAGTVGLVVHVATDGRAQGAEVVDSSGSAALDREARRAVLLWRFNPALADGSPVPFDYPIAIHFTRDP